jgi:hypothetical protein
MLQIIVKEKRYFYPKLYKENNNATKKKGKEKEKELKFVCSKLL